MPILSKIVHICELGDIVKTAEVAKMFEKYKVA